MIPVHPGAAAYIDGEEKTFFDRYGDFIWWGLMALSAMGSAGAWFAGYLKKDERSNNSTLRERLLDMIATARHSDSTEELDQMQMEADDILRNTLRCFEHGAIEQGSLTAFNIALDQFHNAVADRKAVLMSMPQSLQRASAQFRRPARCKPASKLTFSRSAADSRSPLPLAGRVREGALSSAELQAVCPAIIPIEPAAAPPPRPPPQAGEGEERRRERQHTEHAIKLSQNLSRPVSAFGAFCRPVRKRRA